MELPRNAFKQALRDGRRQIGLWCSLPGGIPAEIAAGAGFDWLLFDTEHSPIDPLTVLPQLQAAAGHPGVSAVVRPASNDPVLIKRLLDVGAQSLLVPCVQDADEARAAVAATRYPPTGIRGVAGTTRASGYGRIAGYATKAQEEICVVVQVETGDALERIESIATVEGVDGIFVGPADLAASLGHPGEPGHPAVKERVEDALVRIGKTGRPAGILTLDPGFASRCIELGVVFPAVGLDAAVLARGLDALIAEFSK